MADSKKTSNEMLDGKPVEIFLKTPLFRFKYLYEGEERELMENAVRLSGTVIREKNSGLLVEIAVISNMKRTEKELPFEELFIPFDKIDFVVVNS